MNQLEKWVQLGDQNEAGLWQYEAYSLARRSEGQKEESRRDCRNQVTGSLLGDRKGRAGMQEVAVMQEACERSLKGM